MAEPEEQLYLDRQCRLFRLRAALTAVEVESVVLRLLVAEEVLLPSRMLKDTNLDLQKFSQATTLNDRLVGVVDMGEVCHTIVFFLHNRDDIILLQADFIRTLTCEIIQYTVYRLGRCSRHSSGRRGRWGWRHRASCV